MNWRVIFAHPSTKYYLVHPFELFRFYTNLGWLKLKMLLRTDTNMDEHCSSNLPIDVVMPTLERDYEVVTRVIDSIRKYVRHPIGQIIVISPPSQKIEEMCQRKQCRWIDENTVLPITIKDIKLTINGVNRSGWVFQQLLKWAAVKYVKNDYFLITESDTLYGRPYVFEQEGKTIFACSSALCHIPYFNSYAKLFGESVPAVKNLTSHHMLFNKKYLAQVKQKIEAHTGKPWYKAIIGCIDHQELASISDYDSYGQFVIRKHPNAFVFEHWANRNFTRSMLGNVDKIMAKFKDNTKTFSFHGYDT